MVIRISEEIVNIVHDYVVRRLIAFEGIVYSGTISGPLERIFNPTFGGQKYHYVLDKAGAILYSIVHGHSFADGNKRTGLLTTYLFLMFNGFVLHVPQATTTSFLERMADAANPDAPTEKDAILWIRKNARKEASALWIYAILSVYCKIWGTGFVASMTSQMLEGNTLPYIDRDKLIDKTLRNGKAKPTSICSED